MTLILILAGLVGFIYLVSRVVRASKEDEDVGLGIHRIAGKIEPFFAATAQPHELLSHPPFQEGVGRLEREASTTQLLGYVTGDNIILSCLASEALAARQPRSEPMALDAILNRLNTLPPWSRFFALRALASCVEPGQPLLGKLLVTVDASWMEPFSLPFLQEFVSTRRANVEEKPTFGDGLDDVEEDQARFIEHLMTQLDADLGSLQTEFQTWQSSTIDVEFLNSTGTVWTAETAPARPIPHPVLAEQVAELRSALGGARPRSVILVGESGVGKTAAVRTLALDLQKDGWTIFEAGYADMLAGQRFIGDLEERMTNLFRKIGGRSKILWTIPDLHQLQWAGRHQHSQVSVLDMILPRVETGEILVLGEIAPNAFDRFLQEVPRALVAFETIRLNPLNETATLDLAQRWGARFGVSDTEPLLDKAALREAWNLAGQYLLEKAAPGNLLTLLELTRRRLTGNEERPRRAITLDDLIGSLGSLTGLPSSILDDRHQLDLGSLRKKFDSRVLGQREAIDCLVERVAMIKAGVTDPSRPSGVFLFAGPTGTGKTEIAKTLAEFLFGTEDRMIRIDMSELQTPESLTRLTGVDEWGRTESLAQRIRKQPFSVVLLDEFEKAHPQVWDLFLQVFDDGRLTDTQGNLADFRHAILIVTTNLGGRIPSGLGLGFRDRNRGFDPGTVQRALKEAFRPEFLNRIDRVVVFRALSRETIREILHNELENVMERRGLRNRSWAVEWDESAIEFLLGKGFTETLGARPLKRAIERYFLSPLAVTIVDHRVPNGDQFLFVRSEEDGLRVDFVDPDAAESTDSVAEVAPETRETVEGDARMSVASIALDAWGTTEEVERLTVAHATLRERIDGDRWRDAKQTAIALMNEDDFWSSNDRFSILGEIEYLDRIERATERARSLLERLTGDRPRSSYSRNLVQRVAHQLYLLETASCGVATGEPWDAFVLVEASRGPGPHVESSTEFAHQLGNMYQGWAGRRRMRQEVLESWDRGQPHRLLLGVNGFGAYPILKSEDGLHVLERPAGNGGGHVRLQVRVRVAPQPQEPPTSERTALEQAWSALDRGTEGPPRIVRRYREDPDPLVRDAIRGWRTGRLDRVMEGDFDLIG